MNVVNGFSSVSENELLEIDGGLGFGCIFGAIIGGAIGMLAGGIKSACDGSDLDKNLSTYGGSGASMGLVFGIEIPV
jgi:lactobin A/cerein 7B family class IIb bacteriocin